LRIAIGVSMITAVFFLKTVNHIENLKFQASTASWEASLVGRFSSACLGDFLVCSHKSGHKQGSPEIGHANFCALVCEVHCLSEMVFYFVSSSFICDGLRVPCFEVRCSHLVTYSNREMHKDLLVRFLLDSTA
jgi:hypothetical protein